MDTNARPDAPPAQGAGDATGSPSPTAGSKKKLVGPRAFKLFWDAHSVTGIVIGLALFVIFFAGAFALYRGELHAWADPGLRASETTLSADAITQPLFVDAPPAQGSDVQVTYPLRDRTYFFVRYDTPSGDSTRAVQAYVNASTGEAFTPTVENHVGRSALSEILYDLHFFGQAGIWGEIVSGLVAVFFLFAVVSGIIIHLRKLPKDWHTFRPRSTLRTKLADAHNVLGLVGLPFAAMYAITGAFLSLLVILLAPTVFVVFDGDRGAVNDELAGFEMPPHEVTGEAVPMLPLSTYADGVPDTWHEHGIETATIIVHGWADDAGVVLVYGETDNALTAAPRAALDAATGDVLAASNVPTASALGGAAAAMTNLHYARLGTPVAKILFFFLALTTSAVILTGNILWILVRRPNDPRATPLLHRVLARLTVGIGCGLVAAVPLLFLTTSILPLDLPDLQFWEHMAMFGGWLVLTLAAFSGSSAVGAARWQLALAGVLSLLVPIASGFNGATPWVSLANSWWGILTIDVGFLLMGLALLWTAARLDPPALKEDAAGERNSTPEQDRAGPSLAVEGGRA
ncbi:PepSY-associated TM helix domain-containing protein [Longibacter sp.]|uniref:PepSY-associated TM helix domain-containing protein n=1 Tax=Longibacter sp. TaxID=2045415 RepID=UPI003EBD7BA4